MHPGRLRVRFAFCFGGRSHCRRLWSLRFVFPLLAALLALGVCFGGSPLQAEITRQKRDVQGESSRDVPFAIGGTGGAYFLAEPGELTIDLYKRDRNRTRRRTDLRAILVGPDRHVLKDVTLRDDGKPVGKLGPWQHARLTARVERKGVYGLNITVSHDRYGDHVHWGFRTNCRRYLIETARGHRDRRREEPIVLAQPEKPGDVCFLPRQGAFDIEVAGLPKDVKKLEVFDADGATVATLDVGDDRSATRTLPANVQRDAVPWRLHLPRQRAVIQIDGVTRWGAKDLYPNLPYWTPDPKSWFPFHPYRWLLTPYKRLAYGAPGEKGKIELRVHNNSARAKTIQLATEFPADPWAVRLSAERVTLKPKEAKPVTLRYTVPREGKEHPCHIRATPTDDPVFSTYSTVTVRPGRAPASRPLTMPLVLKPYRHQNALFGYLPEYPLDWEMYFDLQNRPLTRTDQGLCLLRNRTWTHVELQEAVRKRVPPFQGAPSSTSTSKTKIAFDRDNDLYALADFGGRSALLHSTDGGRTFTAHALDRGRQFDIEQFSGHNVPDGPPPVLRSIRKARDKRLRWRVISDLHLFLPTEEEGRLTLGDPILLSKESLGVGAHSGVPSAVVSRGSKVHVVWAEATDPKVKVPGVPTYVNTYDRETKTLGKPVLVGYGAPPNDVHNRPSITMDSKGYLHVLTGTHGRPFHYARSRKPNDSQSGWTEAKPVGEGLRQTYIGMVCGPDDTLHIAFRLWRHDKETFDSGAIFATLAYQRKRRGEPWEPPRILIKPPFSEYSIFYHRLTIDRKGRLFLSYDYWSTYWFYRTDHVGNRRGLLMSPDGGETWKLAETADFP